MSVSIATMVLIATTVTIAMTSFPFPDKLGKVWFFQKTFSWLTLAWSFIFISADLRSAGTELVWVTYTTVDDQAGGTFRSKGTCGYDLRSLECSLVVNALLNLRVPDKIVELHCRLLRQSYPSTPVSMIILLTWQMIFQVIRCHSNIVHP